MHGAFQAVFSERLLPLFLDNQKAGSVPDTDYLFSRHA
jgi:hypothetical protein